MEENETYVQCAVREFKEETGISISNIRLSKQYKKEYGIDKPITKYFIGELIKMPSEKEKEKITNEIMCTGWFTIGELNHIYIDNDKKKIIIEFEKKWHR